MFLDSEGLLVEVKMEKILILVPLVLLFGLMQTADSMMIRFNFTLKESIENIPLDMADDSVDDMYFGCQKEMEKKVMANYLKQENKLNKFREAWDGAERCVKVKKKKNNKGLTKYQMRAICAYTNESDFYSNFNRAVREGGSKYGSSFAFHTVHYFLTSAVQTLNSKYKCQITYRRTKDNFIGNVNQKIRFGSFASSSKKTNSTSFGSVTCFQIKTCYGAFLGNYSMIPTEQEVLIPPYELFKITEKFGRGTMKELKDCKVVYVLESLGIMSKLNCRAVFP